MCCAIFGVWFGLLLCVECGGVNFRGEFVNGAISWDEKEM